MNESRATFVYFIFNPQTNEIKIGQSVQPESRLATLAREQDAKLILLGTMEDRVPLETILHRQFAHLKVKGEWFAADDELVDYVNKDWSRKSLQKKYDRRL